MDTSFKYYLQQTKPTWKGTICILVMALIGPLFVDLFISLIPGSAASKISLTLFSLTRYLSILLLAFIYHTIYYFIWKGFQGKFK